MYILVLSQLVWALGFKVHLDLSGPSLILRNRSLNLFIRLKEQN